MDNYLVVGHLLMILNRYTLGVYDHVADNCLVVNQLLDGSIAVCQVQGCQLIVV